MVFLLEWRLRGCAAQRRGVLGLRNQIVFCSERADNGHGQTISQSSVNDCAKKNLCLLVNVTAKFLHEDFDLRERHTGPTCHLREYGCSVRQHPATIHQWIFKRLRESVVRAIVRIGFAKAKQATAVVRAQCCQQIIEADAN
jgi:hypothetical protein